jgi:glycerol-3-phosphate acyltransferase PlsY
LVASIWAVILLLTGYVSLASIAAAAVLPVAVYLLEHPTRPELLWIDVLVAVGVIVLHRRNIERLLKGTESRFGRRAASTPRT